MSDTRPLKSKRAIYEIRIRGRLDEDWIEWFDEMALTHTDEGQTILAGPVPDQAALHGILNKIRNLNLELVSVTQIEADSKDEVNTWCSEQAKSEGDAYGD